MSASADVYRKEFGNFSPVPETKCLMEHAGLTIDH